MTLPQQMTAASLLHVSQRIFSFPFGLDYSIRSIRSMRSIRTIRSLSANGRDKMKEDNRKRVKEKVLPKSDVKNWMKWILIKIDLVLNHR